MAGKGIYFERLIEDWGARYARDGHALVLRTPPPFRILRRKPKGSFVGVLAGEGPPDYTMLLKLHDGSALPVLAEAKSNQSGPWALKQLHGHQAEQLQAWSELGGFSCVLLAHMPSLCGYVIPWTNLKPVWDRWHSYSSQGQRSPKGLASIHEGSMAQIGEKWPFIQGFREAMIRAAQK